MLSAPEETKAAKPEPAKAAAKTPEKKEPADKGEKAKAEAAKKEGGAKKAEPAKTEPAKKEEKKEEKSASDLIAPKVRALIKQLDASEQAKREAAEKELIALGQDVLPLLPSRMPARRPR